MKKAFAYLRLVSSIALAVVFVAGLIVGTIGYYARFGKAKLTFLNYCPAIVVSGSMIPTIQINAPILIEYCDISEVEEGDIVVYENFDIMVVHRAIDVSEESGEIVITTKGDNNIVLDDVEITKENFRGKAIFIWNSGAKLFGWLITEDKQINFHAAIGITIGLTAVILLVDYLKEVGNKKNKDDSNN